MIEQKYQYDYKCPFCDSVEWEDLTEEGEVLMLSMIKEVDIKELDGGNWSARLPERWVGSVQKPYVNGIPIRGITCKKCGNLAFFSIF